MACLDVKELGKLRCYITSRGILTIPKKFRKSLGLEENSLIRIKKDKWRLVVEPVRTLPYPVRRYTDEDLEEFFKLDAKETKNLKKKIGWVKIVSPGELIKILSK